MKVSRIPLVARPERRATWLRRVATVASAVAMAASVAAAPAVAGVSAREQHCLLAEQDKLPTCYTNFRAAMSAATGGRVTDAPLSAAHLDDKTIQRITAAGDSASAARLTGQAAAAPVVLSIGFSGRNLTGSTLSLTSETNCADHRKKYWDSFPTGWDNRIQSYTNISDCATRYYENVNQGGRYETWYRQDTRRVAVYSGMISSASMEFGPTRRGLINMCDSEDVKSCTFHASGQGDDVSSEFREVARTYNCSADKTSDLTASWAQTTGGSIWLSGSITVSATYSAGALAEVSAAITIETGREWNWSNTVESSTTVNDVGPHEWGAVDRAPKLQYVEGVLDVELKKSMWGSDTWRVYEFAGITEDPDHLGVTRTRTGAMTDAQVEQLCGTQAARTAAPTTQTSNYQITAKP